MPYTINKKDSISLITFDLDNTLWDTNQVIHQAERTLYQWLEDNVPKVTNRYSLEELQMQRYNLAKDNKHLRSQISELRRISLENVIDECGYKTSDAKVLSTEGFNAFFEARQQVSLFPDVQEVLSTLNSRYTLGSLTNGNADLNRIGLDHFFSFSLSAETENSSKPAPEQFETALNIANCSPQQAIHIGDHPIDDISGAAQCGFHTIWVNFSGNVWDQEHKPSKEATSIVDLIEKIDEIERD